MAKGLSLYVVLLAIIVLTSTYGLHHHHKRSDDVTVASLQTLVLQQASLIQNLEADLTATKTRLSSLETSDRAHDNDIATIKHKQSQVVAFTARYNTENGTAGVPLTLHSILKFDRIVYNVGNGYSTRTGIFTAPVSGTYAFYLTMMSVNGHTSLSLLIVREGSALDLVYAEGNTDNYDQASSEVTCHLATGQQVWIQQSHGDAVRGGYSTVFTGYLIHAD